jgi:glycosyltransferase involved in cell wall biosynthesis
MKVVLLVLSGDPLTAHKKLTSDYPDAQIQTIPRNEIEGHGFSSRLKKLRSLHPDIFAIATERLQWQRGQHLFMLFGALAGARNVIMLDAHGSELRRTRSNLFMTTPMRLGSEAIEGTRIDARARRQLTRLENEVAQHPLYESLKTNSRPRILYLRSTPGPGTQIGGASSHIKGVVEGLIDLGAQVNVISNDQIAGFDNRKVPLTIIEPVSSGATRAIFDINNNLHFTNNLITILEQQEKPDFIYQRYARFSWAGVVAALETRRPLFLEYNGSEVWVGQHWDRVGRLELLERYERLNLQAAARIFVVSEVERRNLEKRGIDPLKILVSPNGVDAQVFHPGVGGDEVRSEHLFKSDEVVVGFVGTFGPWHGVLVLAEAIKKVPPDLPLRFLFVGAGSLQTQVQQFLQSDVEKGRVIFTGPVDHAQVPSLLDACDILVSPHVPLTDGSEFFGSPTKLFEYMAMGKGIVASRLGQIGDVLAHEGTALLVEPGDADALAAAIQRLAQSKELRAQLGARAITEVAQKYTWRHSAQRVLDAYNSLAS